MNWDNYQPWKGKKCIMSWGITGHEGEWVVNIDGYGHGLSEKFLERSQSQRLQDLLPKGCRVDNRGSRLEVYGPYTGTSSPIHEKVESEVLAKALKDCGLIVDKVVEESYA